MRRVVLILVSVAAIYVAGYAVLRWRKVLILREGDRKGCLVEAYRWVDAGHDFRNDWRGRLKNWLSGPATVVFFPLIWVESTARSGRRVAASVP